ncbi:MAG: HPr(Ser) kinase/phosphatase [Polyangiales bacterium]
MTTGESGQQAATGGVGVTVRTLLADPLIAPCLRLHVPDSDVERRITHPRIQKNGLGLAGHRLGVAPTRIQILGETELSYLEARPAAERTKQLQQYFALQLSCVVLSRGAAVPPWLQTAAAASHTPLLWTPGRSSECIALLHAALDRLLAPSAEVHGVLLAVHGVGTLLTGPSGIGKSETALVLIERGHRLVADDRVALTRRPDGLLEGSAPVPLRHHLEVRGIGIVNIRDLFGATAVLESTDVRLRIVLQPAQAHGPCERLGLDRYAQSCLGVQVPTLCIPVRPGRDLAVIVEVAVRHHLLQCEGLDSPARLLHDALCTAPKPADTQAQSAP